MEQITVQTTLTPKERIFAFLNWWCKPFYQRGGADSAPFWCLGIAFLKKSLSLSVQYQRFELSRCVTVRVRIFRLSFSTHLEFILYPERIERIEDDKPVVLRERETSTKLLIGFLGYAGAGLYFIALDIDEFRMWMFEAGLHPGLKISLQNNISPRTQIAALSVHFLNLNIQYSASFADPEMTV